MMERRNSISLFIQPKKIHEVSIFFGYSVFAHLSEDAFFTNLFGKSKRQFFLYTQRTPKYIFQIFFRIFCDYFDNNFFYSQKYKK